MAWSPEVLIMGRTAQGAAAGILMPQVLATFRALFKGKDRGKVFAVYGAVAGLASALGVVLGGLLTQADLFGTSWRMIFLINVPVAAAVMVAAVAVVPETRVKSVGRPDVLGGAVLMVALVAIVYPLLEGRSAGWPAWTWLMLGLGIAAVVVLGAIESRRTDGRVAPLLQTRLFRIPAYSAGLVVQLVFYLGLQGSSLILALWLQAGQGYSPLRAGLTMVAFSVGAFLTIGFSVQLAPRFGRLVLVAGGLLMAVGMTGIDLAARHAAAPISPWALVPGMVVAGAGLGLLVVPLVNVVLAAVPVADAGGASGVFSTAQQFGGAIGVAVMGSVFFGHCPPAPA